MPAPRPRRSAAARVRPAPASVVRVTEATGSSPRGWDIAVAAAVKASEVRDPVGVEVTRFWGEWAGRKIGRYHVTVKVAYRQRLKVPTR